MKRSQSTLPPSRGPGTHSKARQLLPTTVRSLPNDRASSRKETLQEDIERDIDDAGQPAAASAAHRTVDSHRSTLSRQSTSRYPGSIIRHPVQFTSSRTSNHSNRPQQLTQLQQQQQGSNRSSSQFRPTSHRETSAVSDSCSSSGSSSSADDDDGERRKERASRPSRDVLMSKDVDAVAAKDKVGNKENLSQTTPTTAVVSAGKRVVRKKKTGSPTVAETTTEPDDDTDAAGSIQDKRRKRKRKIRISANLSCSRYDVVRDMVEYVGFVIGRDDDQDCFLIWSDAAVSNERISELKPYQRINHFPGMGEICRKDSLARNMAKMARSFPLEYNFVPKTWILPSDYASFQTYAHNCKKNKKRGKTFIMKPANGAMGNGIQLIQCPEKVPSNEHIIIQEYIDKPFLVDGFKCDMRIYVLVSSCDPLRIFLFNDGLLRMSTENYMPPSEGNLDNLFMHLTNYSINKHSTNYRKDEAGISGSKRSLRYFSDYLRRLDYDVAEIWTSITDLIIKTMIVAHPLIYHAYRMCRPGQAPGADSVCFEILGFDVMLDRKLRPWLLEEEEGLNVEFRPKGMEVVRCWVPENHCVSRKSYSLKINRSPSFGTDEQLDYDIKSAVIEDALRLIRIRSRDKKKNLAEEKAQAQRRLLRLTRRRDADKSEEEKRRESVERKKEELYALLERIQRDDEREEHENSHIGRYRRIFPPVDRLTRIRYANLLATAYQTFLSGRQAQSLNLEIQRLYSCDLKEYEIRDMLAQFEEQDEQKQQQQQQQQQMLSPHPLVHSSLIQPNLSSVPATEALLTRRSQFSSLRWLPSPSMSASGESSLRSRRGTTVDKTLGSVSVSRITRRPSQTPHLL